MFRSIFIPFPAFYGKTPRIPYQTDCRFPYPARRPPGGRRQGLSARIFPGQPQSFFFPLFEAHANVPWQ